MSNYPDDIRLYDHDPRSPFYEERDYCDTRHKRADHCTCDHLESESPTDDEAVENS